jgi:hypothetical protein
MTTPRPWLLLVAIIAALASCRDPVDPVESPLCPQTYEFGNYGCARVVATIAAQPDASLQGRVYVAVIAVGLHSGFDAAYVDGTAIGTYSVSLTRFGPGRPGSGDTVSVWVRATVHDNSQLIAADSILRVIRFAPVGQLRTIDSVSLVLKSVN